MGGRGSRIMGLLCVEQDVGNLKQCTFRSYGTLARSKQRRKSTKIEDPGFVEPLLRGVVASDGSKSSTIEDLGFFKSLIRGAVASGGSKSSKIEGLAFLSLS